MTARTFYPRIEPTIPKEVQRHLQLIYEKLNNHGQAFDHLITVTPALIGATQPTGKNGKSAAAGAASTAASLSATQLAELTRQLTKLLKQPVLGRAYREVAAGYAVNAATDFQINCTSGTFTVTLPDAANLTGQIFSVKNSGAGTITLSAAVGQLIDGTATKALTQWDNMAVMSTGANWIIVSTGLSM